MKEMSLFIICLLLISVVSGEEDFTCQAGYSVGIFTSGSQCSGISKITTEAECELAAEYNRENNIDQNDGYGSRFSSSRSPPGCFYLSDINKYYWNYNTKSTIQCSNSKKCICKTKTCIKCPINTYSEGGINPTCTPCPRHAPYTATNLKNIFTSINSCAAEKDPLYCEAGTGYIHNEDKIHVRDSDTCDHQITTEAECKLAAEYNRKNNIDKNIGYGRRDSWSNYPPGCFYYISGNKYYWNGNTTSTKQCSNDFKCICRRKTCLKCPIDTYAAGGAGSRSTCEPCVRPFLTDKNRTKCYNPEIANQIKQFKLDLVAQKEKQNDLSIKNSRLWQKEQIRIQHDKYMEDRKSKDNENEKSSCEKQRVKGTVIFPAIEISNEIEKIEDTTCIDTNRDELLKSFCSFTSDLDNLFQIQSIPKEAKTFWPNICCKERNDKTLKVCEDPSGELKRGEIVPFALSSGGNYSRHNLYVEVTDTIKYKGYLHNGMLELLKSLKRIRLSKKQLATNLVNAFFKSVSTCGPRIMDAPGAKDKKKLCELFIPYQHSMAQFYNLIESLYTQTLPIQTSFLETMEVLRKRSTTARVGKNNIQNVMQMKPKATAQATCTGGSKWVSSKLKEKKKFFCRGYNHLDLSKDTNIRNVAVQYLKQDINITDTEMLRLSKQLRYRVTDDSCPSPLFEAKDISIQRVAMDALGTKKEWVAVVNLNTEDKNGYLQSELPRCESEKRYLIGAKLTVKAYVDNENCCLGEVNYKKCIDGCENKLKKLKDKDHKHYSKDVKLTGTQYRVDDSHGGRRRRLLQQGNDGC